MLEVARRTGPLAAAGLEVTERPVPSSPAQFRALVDGELDVALTSPDNVLAYRFSPDNPLGEPADARIVAAVDRGLGLGALRPRPGRPPRTCAARRSGSTCRARASRSPLYALLEPPRPGPRRLRGGRARLDARSGCEALLAGECDATMLNAGNELLAEAAGCTPAGRREPTSSAPYLGTVVAVVGDAHSTPASRPGRRRWPRDRRATIVRRRGSTSVAVAAAAAALGLDDGAGAALRRRGCATRTRGWSSTALVDPARCGPCVDLRRR